MTKELVRRRPLALLACGFLTMLFDLPAVDALEASFDWSMPDRFGARDPDGKLHYRAVREEVQAPPGGWEVTFNASASIGDIASFDWEIDGEPAARTDGPTFTQRFPRDLVEDREVDVLLISIGGNDAHFAKIVEACMAQESCHTSAKKDVCLAAASGATCARAGPFAGKCRDYFSEREPAPHSGKDIFEAGLGGLSPEACSEICDAGAGYEGCRRKECSSLEEKYALLDAYLGTRLPDLRAEHIYLTGYPDMTRDDRGGTCAHDPEEPLRSVPCLSREETAWARDDVLSMLNGALADAAAAHGWRSIAPSEEFAFHGYCANDHWFVRLQESFPIQGNVNGALHPNVTGHRANAMEAAAGPASRSLPGRRALAAAAPGGRGGPLRARGLERRRQGEPERRGDRPGVPLHRLAFPPRLPGECGRRRQ